MNVLANIQLNDEGFLINPEVWNEEIAIALAENEGIELTDKHWEIIRFCRKFASENGAPPTLLQIISGSGFSTKELFQLFPKGPAKKVARIAGLGKPEGCI